MKYPYPIPMKKESIEDIIERGYWNTTRKLAIKDMEQKIAFDSIGEQMKVINNAIQNDSNFNEPKDKINVNNADRNIST